MSLENGGRGTKRYRVPYFQKRCCASGRLGVGGSEGAKGGGGGVGTRPWSWVGDGGCGSYNCGFSGTFCGPFASCVTAHRSEVHSFAASPWCSLPCAVHMCFLHDTITLKQLNNRSFRAQHCSLTGEYKTRRLKNCALDFCVHTYTHCTQCPVCIVVCGALAEWA